MPPQQRDIYTNAPPPPAAPSGPNRTPLFIGLGVLAAVLLIGGVLLALNSGGDDTVPPEEFAADLCPALSSFQADVGRLQSTLATFDVETAAEGKEIIVEALGDLADDIDELTAEVEDIGVPDVENGEEIADAVPEVLGEAVDVMRDAVEEAEDLPEDDLDAFATEVLELTTRFGERFDEVGADFEDIDTEELDDVLDSEPACEGIEF